MVFAFVVTTSILLFGSALMWKTDDTLNIIIKIVLVGLAVWGNIILATQTF